MFLGDIFQRGNEEIECLELLKDSGIICLKGNCELYMEQGVDIDPDVEYLRDYYDETRKKLTDEQMQFIIVIGHSHQNFVKGNVVSVSASGLEGASYLLIEANEDVVSFEHISIDVCER